MARVHPTSVVEPNVEIADDVVIGPFCHVHSGARIGAKSHLSSHVVVMGRVTLGAANVIHPFVVIGGEAQVRKAGPSADRRSGALEIGDHNVIREGVTVNTSSNGGKTRIGSHNLLMAGSHVAHDVVMGSHCVVANGVQLAGHVVVDDWVTFGGLAAVAQHLHVGESAFVAAGAMCERDVPPFVIVQGDRARVRALNVVGLERRGLPPESVEALRAAFRHLWGPRVASFDEGLRRLDRTDPWVATLGAWLEAPTREIRPRKRNPQRA
jgi:UDP-N-acetylglucosamine acyltransferase